MLMFAVYITEWNVDIDIWIAIKLLYTEQIIYDYNYKGPGESSNPGSVLALGGTGWRRRRRLRRRKTESPSRSTKAKTILIRVTYQKTGERFKKFFLEPFVFPRFGCYRDGSASRKQMFHIGVVISASLDSFQMNITINSLPDINDSLAF